MCVCVSVCVVIVPGQDKGVPTLIVGIDDSNRFWLGYAMYTSLYSWHPSQMSNVCVCKQIKNR